MLTVRISPKISVKPEATMKYSPAEVNPSSRVTTNSPGSSMAAPADVSRAKNSTQATTKAIGMAPMTAHLSSRDRVRTAARAGSNESDGSLTKSAVMAPNSPSARGYGRPTRRARAVRGGPKELVR